ncbi:MAG: hypothetical protein A2Z99_18565 [Treponema sp. GWB1_62_6]|nr:MAG: hypothetical protein A2Z99_18565 [Treponema sp. GWB1_62_6]OHE67932.1 MAG: hypothetical protein A2001_02790 [Treponema sp. GWC1_61_84]HCM25113.1 hypothetical protein [Treponema sp.]
MKQFACILTLAVLAADFSFAHPHMSLESRLEFEYSGAVCTGFWADWTLDPYFSASIIQENDLDRNKRFDAKENVGVHDTAFANLRKFGWFTYIRSASGRFAPEKVERFTASIKGDRLVYRFFVPLEGKGLGKDFSVAIFDSTYYCAVTYSVEAAVTRQAVAGGPLPGWKRETNKKYPVYYNPGGAATDGTVYKEWKAGLETAYPEEIRVRL